MHPTPPEGDPKPVTLQLAWGALGRLALAILIAWALFTLWTELILLLVSVLLAATLEPLVGRIARGRLGRGTAILLLAVILVSLLATLAVFVLPPLSEEVSGLMADLPQLQKKIATELRGHSLLARAVNELLALPTSPEVKRWMARPLSWGMAAFEAIMGLVLVLVFTIYLLLDGKVLYAWLLAYMPRRHRSRMAAMLPEVQGVVAAWLSAQAITCVLFALFAFVVNSAFHVRAAVPLAALAFLCDVVPVLGIVLATVPAVLLALSVSPGAALAVLLLYAGYHLFEAYVLVPRLYGKKLRLSPLAVLLALVVGGALQGIVGAILILPFVAAYPVVEKYWLSEYLSDELVDDHQALHEAEKGDKEGVADAVLRGDPKPAAGR